MKHGTEVAAFERAFAQYVGAKYAIAMTNGTVTLEVALHALEVTAGDRIVTTPLTMAATSIAILNVGAVPVYADVDPLTWLIIASVSRQSKSHRSAFASIPVSLFGLHVPDYGWERCIDDAAQTLRPHNRAFAFTSYSFQRSKILNTGEGGMLVTNDEQLALRARSISSLGYRMAVDQPRIDPEVLKNPIYERHHQYPCMNARMNDLTAREGLRQLAKADTLLHDRQVCADLYRTAFTGFEHFAAPQFVPDGWTHDYWAYAVELSPLVNWGSLADGIVHFGGERPYAAWRLTFDEPAFKNSGAHVPNVRSIQPRLMVFQTNDRGRAAINAKALRTALQALR